MWQTYKHLAPCVNIAEYVLLIKDYTLSFSFRYIPSTCTARKVAILKKSPLKKINKCMYLYV